MPLILADKKNEGKTKIVFAIEGDMHNGVLQAKDDITAGDGAKHDVIAGKAELATQTTCNVFQLLKNSGLPVAYNERVSPTAFSAPLCKMLPYEMVCRRESHGSHQHRAPHLPLGTIFPKIVVEAFAKTSGKKWRDRDIPMDDPLLEFSKSHVNFFLPHWSKEQKEETAQTGFKGYLVGQRPFLTVPINEFYTLPDEDKLLARMKKLLVQAFLVLERAWQLQGRRIVDIKIEFGIDSFGNLLIADVIDNDSWRLVHNGRYECKQSYRDGGELNAVTEKYRSVANLTDRFGIPRQRIILWTGSPKDEIKPFDKALREILGVEGDGALPGLQPTVHVACSAHKETFQAVMEHRRLTQEIPNTVTLAFIGRSNSAGPVLAANCTDPVFNVPAASAAELPQAVWSSLDMPSNNPVATVLNPANAVLAALQVLAMQNPCLYALIRQRQEERFANVAQC